MRLSVRVEVANKSFENQYFVSSNWYGAYESVNTLWHIEMWWVKQIFQFALSVRKVPATSAP